MVVFGYLPLRAPFSKCLCDKQPLSSNNKDNGLRFYSFTEPSVRPETRYRLRPMKTTTTGMLTMIDAAA